MAKVVAAAPSEGAPGAVLPPPRPSGRAKREAQKRRDRRQARYDEIRALWREGHGVRTMARHLHLSRTTVVKYLRADSCPHPAPRPNRRNLVDLWLPHLRQRCAAGCRNAQELNRELKALGFPGGKLIVSARWAQWWTGPHRPRPYPADELSPCCAHGCFGRPDPPHRV